MRFAHTISNTGRSAPPAGIWRVRVKDARLERVIDLTGSDRLWVLDDWMGLTPDDSPLLTRDVSIEEVYAVELAFR
jgi:hypothetical protein